MKKTFAVVFTTAIATVMTATPAQAAPADPVKALAKQLAQGRGVSYTERSATRAGDKSFFERKGLLQYDRSGIVASDITARLNVEDEPPKDSFDTDEKEDLSFMRDPEQTIRIGRTSYVRGFIVGTLMPKGKVWWKQSPGWTSGRSAMLGELINAADPGTLKMMLAKSKRSGSTYAGEITLKELIKLSPWARTTIWWGVNDKAVVRWKLVVSASGLPHRLTTYSSFGNKKRAEIRYTGWGRNVSIKAPAAATVTTKLKGAEGPFLPKAPNR
ncbi:hypothetical protein [Streptosporangium sp. NPDC002607]